MKAGDGLSLPVARSHQLIAEELPDELLIYDLSRHKAHCLNRASAFVWKHCDGKRTVSQLSRLLAKELGTKVDDDVVWLALSQLRRFHLLEEENKSFAWMKVSRRDLVTKYLPAALALPLIISIPSPAAAQAASGCVGLGAPCAPGGPFCCPGLFCGQVCQNNQP